MASPHQHELKITKFETPVGLKTAAFVGLFIGLIAVVFGLFKDPERMWASYLVSFFYFACFGIGALFFLAFSYAAKAGWHSSIKRLAESFTSYLPYMVVTSIIFFLQTFFARSLTVAKSGTIPTNQNTAETVA